MRLKSHMKNHKKIHIIISLAISAIAILLLFFFVDNKAGEEVAYVCKFTIATFERQLSGSSTHKHKI